jgi:hypothetical protein
MTWTGQHWEVYDETHQHFTISREGLLARELFKKYDRPGQMVMRETHLGGAYNTKEQEQLADLLDRTGWVIGLISEEDSAKARKEFEAREFFDECSKPADPKTVGENDEDVFHDTDDLFYAIDHALAYSAISMVIVQASDNGRGIFLRNPERKPTKAIAKFVCAGSDQLQLAQDKYSSFMIDTLKLLRRG